MAKKEYTNGAITVVWKSDLCIHSAVCVKGCPDVFKPREKPWITLDKSTSDEIIATVKKCPSGALTYFKNGVKEDDSSKSDTMENIKVKVIANGPLLVDGPISIDCNGKTEVKEKVFFCRCGSSSNKPYCDGAHNKSGFEG